MLSCSNCAYESPPRSYYCEACGSALARRFDTAHRIADEVEAEFLRMQVKRGQVVLFAVALLQLLFGGWRALNLGIEVPMNEFAAVWTVTLGVPAMFFFLAWWCESSPFAAALVGLIVFVTLHGAAAAVDPDTLTRGLVIKLVVIAVLIQAMAWGVKFLRFKAERGLA